ncbi:MAG TPA: phosphoglycerate mutase family protein [Pseudomonadota bacterium]|nr:phosphoglycerate mutase family protein [Pseudomonadota bacterium]
MRSRTSWSSILIWLAIATGVILVISLQPRLRSGPIVLVRHAEKVDSSKDAALNPAGEARAARLAEVLGSFGIQTIYTSEYKRTAQTAQPLAQRLGLTPIVIQATDQGGLLQQLPKAPRPALIVGHGDTVPALIKQLGVREPVEIAGDDFGNIYVVVPHLMGPPTLLHLRY